MRLHGFEIHALQRGPACGENQHQAMNDELIKVRDWAQDELDAGQAPPWATGRYLHVLTLIDEMLASRAASTPRRAGNVVQLDFTRRASGWCLRSCKPG